MTLPPDLAAILKRLQTGRSEDLAGARVTGTVPVSAALLNEVIAAALPPSASVRAVTVQPQDGDRLTVTIRPKAALLPAVTLKLEIEGQPRLPEHPVLTLRMATLSGLFGLASGAVSGMLPAGITLEGERILVNVGVLARQQGHGELLAFLRTLDVHAVRGRLIVAFAAAVD